MRTLRLAILWIAIAAALGARAESGLQLLKETLPLIYDAEYAYLKAPIESKARYLDEYERIVVEFEKKDTKNELRASDLNFRCVLLQRRVKVAFAMNDTPAVSRYAAEYEQLFVAHGTKLGPKWYEDGKIKIGMIVEFADTEDARQLREFAKSDRK